VHVVYMERMLHHLHTLYHRPSRSFILPMLVELTLLPAKKPYPDHRSSSPQAASTCALRAFPSSPDDAALITNSVADQDLLMRRARIADL